MLHKPKCENNDITTIRISSESHLHWRDHFHKNSFCFRIYADFEANIESDNSSIGNKTTNIYKQNPVLKGYHIESELEDYSRSSCYKFLLGYNNVDSFVDEVIKLENKTDFYFEKSKKGIIMTEKNDEVYRNNNVCRFCEKKMNLIKLEILVISLVITEVQLIESVMLMLHRSKVVFYHLYFITLVNKIVKCSLRNWLI